MIRLCFDVGFSGIKMAELNNGVLSYVKELNAICNLGSENFSAYSGNEKDIVAFNGSHYIIGKSALQKKDATIQKVHNFETMNEITPIVATKYLNNYKPEDVEYLCFTLSSAYLDKSKIFHKTLTDAFPEYKGKIRLVPQGCSAKKAIDAIGLDVDNPSFKDSYKNYLLIDIGFNTVDVASVINGSVLPNDVIGYEHTGAVLIAEEVQRQIKNKYDLELSMTKVKSVLEDKMVKVRSEVYDCKKIITKAVELYLQVLRDFLEKNYAEEMNAISNVILMGGGAEIIRENAGQWNEYYGNNFMILPKVPGSSTFYNALGGLYLS